MIFYQGIYVGEAVGFGEQEAYCGCCSFEAVFSSQPAQHLPLQVYCDRPGCVCPRAEECICSRDTYKLDEVDVVCPD